jgi:hypothetical protein
MWLGDSGATMTVDCAVIYTVDEDGLITSIRAHWEPERAMATLTHPYGEVPGGPSGAWNDDGAC